MEKKKPKLTKIYNKEKRIETDNKEIENYLNILNKKKIIFLSFPHADDELDFNISTWNKIWKLSGEQIDHFIRHILFIQRIKADKSEINDYKKIMKDNRESKKIFFESIFFVSKPLDIPFEMKDSDFEEFNKLLI